MDIKSTKERVNSFKSPSKDDNAPQRLQPPNQDELELIKEHMIQYVGNNGLS